MKEILMSGALALLMISAPAGQSLPAGQDVPAGQQQKPAIPDAPKPQTTGITGVTPGKGAGSPLTTPAAPEVDAPSSVLPNAEPSGSDGDAGPAPTLPGPGQGPGTFTLINRTNFVDVPFTVKDSKNRLVPGLTWRDIRVYENGQRMKQAVFTVDPFPLSVALVIDQSMPFDSMTRVNNALGALQGAFTAYDEVAVFTYNNGVKMQTDFTAGQSPRLAAVVERSKSTGREPMYYDPGGPMQQKINTNNGADSHINPLTGTGIGSPGGLSQQQVPREAHTLNDAILEAAKATTRAGKDRRRVVYVISDGKEYGSVAKAKEVIKYLQTNKIAVYATLTGDAAVAGLGFLDHIHIPLQMRDNILPAYTAATGGETYAEYRQKGIEESFQRIAEDVRTQYTVGYYSNEPALDEKFRKIEVRVLKPNLSVIAKEGYFPSAQAIPPPARRTIPATP